MSVGVGVSIVVVTDMLKGIVNKQKYFDWLELRLYHYKCRYNNFA
jgi:hypothetical protein